MSGQEHSLHPGVSAGTSPPHQGKQLFFDFIQPQLYSHADVCFQNVGQPLGVIIDIPEGGATVSMREFGVAEMVVWPRLSKITEW